MGARPNFNTQVHLYQSITNELPPKYCTLLHFWCQLKQTNAAVLYITLRIQGHQSVHGLSGTDANGPEKQNKLYSAAPMFLLEKKNAAPIIELCHGM
ncbi:hypothetical protein GQ55_9G149100 [Panicum hallii var. hallii]|uniref:Uncharacterized protein n=1 Tax=Panicum hallii var. hallii TaxID=1504633 RepID=A0A2T7C385_9POAL|nr:hypothetical protein GQ55_9G149100 [Panicum hallii var. hallii]